MLANWALQIYKNISHPLKLYSPCPSLSTEPAISSFILLFWASWRPGQHDGYSWSERSLPHPWCRKSAWECVQLGVCLHGCQEKTAHKLLVAVFSYGGILERPVSVFACFLWGALVVNLTPLNYENSRVCVL